MIPKIWPFNAGQTIGLAAAITGSALVYAAAIKGSIKLTAAGVIFGSVGGLLVALAAPDFPWPPSGAQEEPPKPDASTSSPTPPEVSKTMRGAEIASAGDAAPPKPSALN